jgi:hypothetical protein
MLIWMAIGLALAAAVIAGPRSWAIAITVFVLPLSGTAVMMLGIDPILLPLPVATAFAWRVAFSLLVPQNRERFIAVLKQDGPILALLVLCWVSALFFPRLFEGQTYILNQQSEIVPLGPHAASFVQLAYLTLAVLVYVGLRYLITTEGLKALVVGVLAQAAFIGGIAGLQALAGLAGMPVDVTWIVNNEGYRLLGAGDGAGGWFRISSVFPEASVYGHWAAGALAFCYGLYINRILRWTSAAIAAVAAGAMLISTSSTAYVGLLGVAGLATIYALIDPSQRRRERGLLIVFLGAVSAGIAAIFIFSAESGFLYDFRMMIEDATLRKQYSDSGIERGMWNQMAIQAGVDTMFLGAGYGVVRGSALFSVMFGSIGLIGVSLFVLFILPLLGPALRSPRTTADAISTAGAFAVLASILTMAVSGSEFGLAHMIWVYAAAASAPRLVSIMQPAAPAPPIAPTADATARG